MAWTWLTWTQEKIREYSRRFRQLFITTQTTLIAAEQNSDGTKIAIIGPPGSGKTCIWTFLRSGGTKLVVDHQPTASGDRTTGGSITVTTVGESPTVEKSLKLMLADSMDVSGDLANYPHEWDQVLSDAFLVVFLFDVSRFAGLDGPPGRAAAYRKAVTNASKFAGARIRHDDCIVVLALGWCDKLPGWSPTNSAPLNDHVTGKYGRAVKQIRANLGVQTDEPPKQVEGSLATEELAASFIYNIFMAGSRVGVGS